MTLQEVKRYAYGGSPAVMMQDDSQVPAGLTDAILLEILEHDLTDFRCEIIRLGFGLDGPALRIKEIAQRLGTTNERVRRQKMHAFMAIRAAWRAREAAMPVKVGHRKRGSGATTIYIRRRRDVSYLPNGKPTSTPNAGYLVFIGKRLWQDIGCPERVTLSRWGKIYKITVVSAEEDGYTVMAAQKSIPRISVGKSTIRLQEGRFSGTVKERSIVFHVE